MIFDIGIVLYSVRKITIAEKFLPLTTANIKSAKNIFLKIVDFHPIAKPNSAADFCPSKGKIVTNILIVIIRSSKCAIGSCAIYCIV